LGVKKKKTPSELGFEKSRRVHDILWRKRKEKKETIPKFQLQ